MLNFCNINVRWFLYSVFSSVKKHYESIHYLCHCCYTTSDNDVTMWYKTRALWDTTIKNRHLRQTVKKIHEHKQEFLATWKKKNSFFSLWKEISMSGLIHLNSTKNRKLFPMSFFLSHNFFWQLFKRSLPRTSLDRREVSESNSKK